MIDYQEGLADAFLSEVRYGGKFLITYNESRYEQLRQFKKDFDEYLRQLRDLDDSQSIGASLSKIERLQAQYDQLFGREVEYVRARQNYAQSRFQQERDKITENALGELDQLKAQLRSKLQHKIEIIDLGARKARNIAIVAFLVVLVLGVWISISVSATSRLHSAPLPHPRRPAVVRLASRAR
jgi:CHASE3 domain sensor protein